MATFVRIALAAMTLVAAGCTHMAGDRHPPESLPAPDVIYDTQAVVGECAPGAEAAPLLTALAGSAISQGINRIGEALKAAAETQTEVVVTRRNMDLTTSNGVGPCVTVARGWFYRNTPVYSGQPDRPASPFADNPASAWPYRQRAESFWQKGLFLAAVPDFFFQGALITSTDSSRYSIVPNVVTMDVPISRTALRPSNERHVVVAFAIGEQELDLAKGAGATMVIGKLRPGQKAHIPTDRCVFQSGAGRPNACPAAGATADIVLYGSLLSDWFSVPMTSSRKPMYLQAMVSETRDASKFLGFLAAVFNDSSFKTALNTQAQQMLIPSVGQAADDKAFTEKMKLDNEYDFAIVSARAALQTCVKDPASADGRLNARIALRKLMVAAVAAGKAQLVNGAIVDAIAVPNSGSTPCQTALALLA